MTAGLSPSASRLGKVRWPRLATWAALSPITMLAVAQFVTNLSAYGAGGDFRGGIWPAGADVLHGRSPYAPADPHRLLVLPHSFITPPPLAILAVPFSLLAFSVALAVWNLMSAAALCLALRLMGVRDQRIYLLAFCTLPVWDSFANGQPDGVFALAAALAWRFRASWPGGVAAGALIAAKLLAWPLLIWVLVMRRIRSLTVTIGSAIVILLGSWALIGFRGLAQYPSLLAADVKGRAVAIPMAISVLLLGATSIRTRAGAETDETAVPTGPATGAAHGPAAGYRRGDPTWSAT